MSFAGVHRLRGLLLLGLVANHRGALWVAEVTRKGGSAMEATEAEGVCDFNAEIPSPALLGRELADGRLGIRSDAQFGRSLVATSLGRRQVSMY